MFNRGITQFVRISTLSFTMTILAGSFFGMAANAAADIPWLNRPAIAVTHQLRATVSTHPCASNDLEIVAGQQGARKGFATQEVLMTNRGTEACHVLGAPTVQLIPKNTAPQTLATHPNASSNVHDRAELAPGDTAVMLIETPGSCDAAIHQARRVNTQLKVAPFGGGSRTLDGVHVDTLCGNASILYLQIVHAEPPSQHLLSQLVGTLDVPKASRSGNLLHYTVTLTNPTDHVVSLEPCPTYTQSLYANGASASTSFLLNCNANRNQIAPRASVRFSMQLDIPTNFSAANAKLSWTLEGGMTVGNLISLQ